MAGAVAHEKDLEVNTWNGQDNNVRCWATRQDVMNDLTIFAVVPQKHLATGHLHMTMLCGTNLLIVDLHDTMVFSSDRFAFAWGAKIFSLSMSSRPRLTMGGVDIQCFYTLVKPEDR